MTKETEQALEIINSIKDEKERKQAFRIVMALVKGTDQDIEDAYTAVVKNHMGVKGVMPIIERIEAG